MTGLATRVFATLLPYLEPYESSLAIPRRTDFNTCESSQALYFLPASTVLFGVSVRVCIWDTYIAKVASQNRLYLIKRHYQQTKFVTPCLTLLRARPPPRCFGVYPVLPVYLLTDHVMHQLPKSLLQRADVNQVPPPDFEGTQKYGLSPALERFYSSKEYAIRFCIFLQIRTVQVTGKCS